MKVNQKGTHDRYFVAVLVERLKEMYDFIIINNFTKIQEELERLEGW